MGTSGLPNLAWYWGEGFQEEVTTVANSKEKISVRQEKISEKFNTGGASRYRPRGT